MRKEKIITALILATSISLSGCSSFVNSDVAKYPLVPELTTQEVVDYYAKALEYDSIVSKNITVHEIEYETQDIKGSKEEKLRSLVADTQAILSNSEYEYTEENAKLVSPDTFNYVKVALDNEVLTNGTITQMKGALGYYFVDVEYDISKKSEGSFNQLTELLGLDGIWLTQWDGSYKVDYGYLQTIITALNKYFYDNSIVRCAVLNDETQALEILDGVDPDPFYMINTANTGSNFTMPEVETPVVEETVEETADTENAESEAVENTDSEVENTESESTETVETPVTESEPFRTTEFNSIVSSERKNHLDIDLIDSVVGSSLNQKAFLPELSLVYNIPEAEGEISGYGIYTAGNSGLKLFGFDRNNLSGKVTLRYVFKDDAAASGDIIGKNIYIVDEEITTGTNVSDQNVIVPEFLLEQFAQLIERADRVIVNVDTPALLSCKIYEDMGVGVLNAFKDNSVNTLKYMSTIRQVISRDSENNAYLVEVETTLIDGPKALDSYGTYRDKSYVVIQQQGDKFVISDQIRISRELVREPDLNPDTAIVKRLVALNLSGDIEDDTKKEIIDLMTDLYRAGTARKLTVSKEDATEELSRGMYDCFNSDPTMLSSDKLEYLNSQLRNKLVKYGVNTPSTYSGVVTRWIGGYENQAEFTTEELITYSGRGTGEYEQVYYLVSKMSDIWVIDERTVIDEREVEGAELESIKSRVGQ